MIDKKHDEESLRSRIVWALLQKRVRKAESMLRRLGLDLPPVEVLVRQQHLREAVDGQELDYYSHATEEIYSKIFSHTANLAGAPENAIALAEVGRQVGRIAYVLDNYIDSENDHHTGSFNLYDRISQFPASRATSREILDRHVNQSMKVIQEQISKVTLNRFRAKVRHVVTDGLRTRVQKLTGNAGTASGIVLYSAAPLVFAIVLGRLLSGSSSSAGCDSCCDCGSCCKSGSSSSRSTGLLAPLNAVGGGVVGGLIGAAGGYVVSQISSLFGGSASAPAEAPTEVSSPDEELSKLENEPDNEQELEEQLGPEEEPGPETEELPPPLEPVKTPPKLPEKAPELSPREEASKVTPEPAKVDMSKRAGLYPPSGVPTGPDGRMRDYKLPEDPIGPQIAEAPPDIIKFRGVDAALQDYIEYVKALPEKMKASLQKAWEGEQTGPPGFEGWVTDKVVETARDTANPLIGKKTQEQVNAERKISEEAGAHYVRDGKLSELQKVPTTEPELKTFAAESGRAGRPVVNPDNVNKVMKHVLDMDRSFAAAEGLDTYGSAVKGVQDGFEVVLKPKYDGGGLGEAAKRTGAVAAREQAISTFGSPQQLPPFQAVAKPPGDEIRAMEILKDKLGENVQVDPNNLDHQDKFLEILKKIKNAKGDYDTVITR